MKPSIQVASRPSKPLMIYDGDCQFCTFWANRWRRASVGRMDFLPLQDPRLAERFPEIPRADFERAVYLIDTNGSVYSAAEAVFRALGLNPCQAGWLKLYLRLPLFARLVEWCYRVISQRRRFFSALTRKFFAEEFNKPG